MKKLLALRWVTRTIEAFSRTVVAILNPQDHRFRINLQPRRSRWDSGYILPALKPRIIVADLTDAGSI
jgi:hypothetical protein